MKLYHQVHKSILSGAPRAGDRLHAAGLRDDDRCAVDNKRHDIVHLWWHCSKHQKTRSFYTKAIQASHDKLVKQIGSFASIRVQETINLTCFQHCGICPEQDEIIEARKQRDTYDNDLHAAIDITKIIDGSQPGVRLEWHESTRYVIVYTDGSLVNGKSFWRSSAAWAIFVAPGHAANKGCKLVHDVQCNYRAELRAVVEAMRYAADPVWVKSDRLGVVDLVQAIIDDAYDNGSDDNQDLIDIIKFLVDSQGPKHYKVSWVPSHLLESKKSHKLKAYLDKGGDMRDLVGNQQADNLANMTAELVDGHHEFIAIAKTLL